MKRTLSSLLLASSLLSTSAFGYITHGVFPSQTGLSSLQLDYKFGAGDCNMGSLTENYYTVYRVLGQEYPGEMTLNCSTFQVRVFSEGRASIRGDLNRFTKVLSWYNVPMLGRVSFQVY